MQSSKSRSDKFTAEYVTIIKPPCVSCKHRSKASPRFCLAFPSGKGIPVAILMGENDHTQPYPGDNGVRYEVAG